MKRDGSGLLVDRGLLSRSSGTEPRQIEGRNFGVKYRTVADLREIPHEQWERWILTDSVPWAEFSAERRCQRMTRYLLAQAAKRIMRRGR